MSPVHKLSTAQLRQAVKLRELINALHQKLAALLNNAHAPTATDQRAKGKRIVSAKIRARMAAAQKANWKKAKGASTK